LDFRFFVFFEYFVFINFKKIIMKHHAYFREIIYFYIFNQVYKFKRSFERLDKSTFFWYKGGGFLYQRWRFFIPKVEVFYTKGGGFLYQRWRFFIPKVEVFYTKGGGFLYQRWRFFIPKVEVFYTKGGGFLYLGEQSLYELLKY
jgi:hypothetical protein